MSTPSSGPNHRSHPTPVSEDGASEFEKRRRAFERESSNVQILSSPGMAFGVSSQRAPGIGRSQEQPRPPTRTQRQEEVAPSGVDLAIGEETGQKEKVFHAPQPERTIRPPSQPRLASPPVVPPEVVGRESPVLSQQIAVLRIQNEQLQQQLREREAEKERLSKQLEAKDKNSRSNYSPIGLPSRVLDGRQVLRDSLPSSATPPPRPLTPSSPLSPSPQLPLSPKPFGSGDLFQLNELRRINRHLEQRLAEVVEEKRRLEVELQRQRDTLDKVQEREQDLTQDIETLRTENSHHTGAITRLKVERDKLKTTSSQYQSQLNSLKSKLENTEKCYGEVEQENLTLHAEIEQLCTDKNQLSSELHKLQLTMEDAIKTKENYRSTIRQLREQNVSLEGQLSGTERAQTGEVKVQSAPVSKGQQVLSEVMNLRQEKTQLKGRLKDAQEEIDTLEATLKEHAHQEVDVSQFREVLTAHLEGFREQVLSISDDLQLSKDAITTLALDQQSMVHDNFLLLAEKCRDELQHATEGKGQLTDALSKAESSLATLQEDYERLCKENEKLVSQKSNVSTDISKLQSEMRTLQDQKKMLEVQLSRTNTLTQQRDDELQSLKGEKIKLEERLQTSERQWRKEFGRLEREWEGKVAMATQAHELLVDSKEALELDKLELERKLSEIEHENKQLVLIQSEFEIRVSTLEQQLSAVNLKCAEKEDQITNAQRTIARLLAEKALLRAEVSIASDSLEEKLAQVRLDTDGEVEAAKKDVDNLSASVKKLEAERTDLLNKLAKVVEKETKIQALTTKVKILTNEKQLLETDLRLLSEKHSQAQQEFQLLAETEQRRELDNEKLKMTLTTEIELLKSKLKTLEESRENEGSKDKPTSAFQPVIPQSRPSEQLLKPRGSLQLEGKEKRRTSSNDSLSSRLALADLQSRLSCLEVENKQLKEAASDATRGGQEALEVMTSLRKQISELSRKGFYLESEKRQLMEKQKNMQGHLKLAREMREKIAPEKMLKFQEDNKMLLERVRILEGSLTKKMMSADLKIVQTVKENDKLRHKLVKIYSSLEGMRTRQTGFEELLSSLKEQSSVLAQLQQSLADAKSSVLQLESKRPTSVPLRRHPTSPPLTQVDTGSGRSITLVRSTLTNSSGSVVRTGSPIGMATKGEQLKERNEELSQALRTQQEAMQMIETKLSSLTANFTGLLEHFEQSVASGHEMCEGVASLREWELRPDQLKSMKVLEQKLESLQDQVIDRESALQDIEVQMKKDYSEQEKKFTSLKSQVIQQMEQISTKDNFLRTKDLYIQQLEEKQLACENQLYQAHVELERIKRDMLTHGVTGGQPNMSEVVRVQGDEILQLQKLISDFSFEINQLQGQLDGAQRDKSMLQSKTLELERMHLHMKEALDQEIDYLRKLNMQCVNQHMKAEKATEILKEVKKAQERFKQQRDIAQLETELDSSKFTMHEQSRRISELEAQLANQNITIKVLQAEKNHAFLLGQHVKDMSNQIGGRTGTGYLRPHSAEARSSQMWKYKLKGKDPSKSLGSTGRAKSLQVGPGEFSIPLPFGQGVDILDLEVQPEPRQSHIQLGPAVVTDDEYSQDSRDVAKTKTLRPNKSNKSRLRGHRRTASTGSDVIPPMKGKGGNIGQSGGGGVAPPQSFLGKLKGAIQWYPQRPGSAGSTRQATDYKFVEEEGVATKPEPRQHSPNRGRTASLGGAPLGKSTLVNKFPEVSHPKLANKSTDSNETSTSSESKGSSGHSDSGPGKLASLEGGSQGAGQDSSLIEIKHTLANDLVRHESCSSSSSIYRSLLPSRTPSFYDGSESSPYESASLEIGDSVENLQMFTAFGSYPGPYLLPIPKQEPTSSSDDDYGPAHPTRRKKSEGSHDIRRHKDISDHSNSSCDSDQLQHQSSYRGNKSTNQRDSIPVHRNESISISDMEKCATDVEQNDKKVADLRKNFKAIGRKRVSSTGSMKICYSESSNTSLEDISRN